MIITQEYFTPRNLFEKLSRNAQRLDEDLNGDSIFNFCATAYFLQDWIKRSPIIDSETVKRLLRRVEDNRYISLCDDILHHYKNYRLVIDDETHSKKLIIDDEELDPHEFKNSILELYSIYFKLK